MAEPSIGIRVDGLRELRARLLEVDRQLPRELGLAMKRAAERDVVPRARDLAPQRSGRLAESLRLTSVGTRVQIRSSLPYAPVIQWGGTVGHGHLQGHPGSGATRIRPSRFIDRALDEQLDAFAAALGEELERFFAQHGLK